MSRKFKRAHLRAPLSEMVLYLDNLFVFKASILNISEGGMLLENLPIIPSDQNVAVLIPLPRYPSFQKVSDEVLQGMGRNDFQLDVVRGKAKIVRSFEGQSEVEKIFVTKIGCQFFDISDEGKQKIADYVDQFSRNVVHVLNLFENAGGDENLIARIRHYCWLLGYPHHEKLTMLRQKILHDYQSLESS